jgi:4-amino-4-deoxy-L-arabinose transferase-like glycosyltransferase
MRARGYLLGMVVVLLVATLLRLAAFGEVPPGLYHDEAFHGLDALDILQGDLSFYFPANNGREPLFIYLVALSVRLLGKSPFALRLVSTFAGLLTVAATAAMGRALFSRRVGLLAAAVLAVTLWHVHLSRVGFRAVLLPLFTALAIWQGALGARESTSAESEGRQWRHWVAAGVFYGLSFYTYTAARSTPVALAAFGAYIVLAQSPISNLQSPVFRRLCRDIGLGALAALLAVAPLAVYAAGHSDQVLGRLGQVSILNPAINGGDLWSTLGAHTLRTLGMFFVRGDRIWRHNVPWRPIFDPLLGGAFIVGLLVALRRARRASAIGFVLIWTAVMSLPTLLAEDAPHFLRSVGMLPVVVFLPALGLDWLADRLSLASPPRRGPGLSHLSFVICHLLILVFPLLFGLASTARAYLSEYARAPMAGYWFEHGAVGLAGRINAFLGAGWDGERMLHGEPGDQRAFIDLGLWEEWPQVRFLVADQEVVTVGLDGEPRDGPAAVFVWPYGEWERASLFLRALVPAPAELSVEEGPLSQGDRDPEPYRTYLAFFGAPADPAAPVLARFSEGIELLGVQVTPVDVGSSASGGGDQGGVQVRLRWRATAPLAEDYTVFLHYLRDGERIAQADGRPAGGRYPTAAWRPGDVIDDDHYVPGVGAPLPGHDVLLFGLWQPESGVTLSLLDEVGNPVGDWFEVPVDGLLELDR